jgi:hypothetical protein
MIRQVPETYNRQDWPRLLAQAVNSIINALQPAVGAYRMAGNATATDIVTVDEGVKVAGTTTANAFNERFTHSDNRLTYTNGRKRLFVLSAIGDEVNGGNNHQYAFSFYKNGAKVVPSEKIITADSGGRASVFVIRAIVELEDGDYVEVWVEDQTASTDVTISHLNVTATPLI